MRRLLKALLRGVRGTAKPHKLLSSGCDSRLRNHCLLAIAAFLVFETPVRSAVLFDGADDILGFGTMGDAVFTENGALTASVWFNATSLGESSVGSLVRRGGVVIRVATGQAIQFSVTGGTTLVRLSNTSVFSLGVWTHLLVTWDGSTTAANVSIYVNGVEVGYATTTNGATPTENSADGLTIGSNPLTTATFDGQITEVAAFPAVLGASSIATLFSRTSQTPLMCSTAPTAYWPLDDFTDGATVSGTIRDRSGNGYNGAATNSPVARASVVLTGP